LEKQSFLLGKTKVALSHGKQLNLTLLVKLFAQPHAVPLSLTHKPVAS